MRFTRRFVALPVAVAALAAAGCGGGSVTAPRLPDPAGNSSPGSSVPAAPTAPPAATASPAPVASPVPTATPAPTPVPTPTGTAAPSAIVLAPNPLDGLSGNLHCIANGKWTGTFTATEPGYTGAFNAVSSGTAVTVAQGPAGTFTVTGPAFTPFPDMITVNDANGNKTIEKLGFNVLLC